jgi:hypothetical protein
VRRSSSPSFLIGADQRRGPGGLCGAIKVLARRS